VRGFLTVTRTRGNNNLDRNRTVHINPAHILLIDQDLKDPNGTALELTNGVKVIIKESLDEVRMKLEQAQGEQY
jgi:uncharacterized protein YlzI (FlbEa/FlbD family)